MITASLDVSGFDPLKAVLSTDKVNEKTRQNVKRGGMELFTEMQRQAHFHRYEYKNPDTPKPTGALKGSISLEFSPDGLTAVVGPHVYYAAYVEYGTRRMTAEPYARPAVDIIRPKFLRWMREMD